MATYRCTYCCQLVDRPYRGGRIKSHCDTTGEDVRLVLVSLTPEEEAAHQRGCWHCNNPLPATVMECPRCHRRNAPPFTASTEGDRH